MNSINNSSSSNSNRKNGKSFEFDYSESKVKEVAKKLVANIPNYDHEIQLYLEADDPDSGIDAEYHPKNDKLYCWRIRRLIAERYLYSFEVMIDGDIAKVIS